MRSCSRTAWPSRTSCLPDSELRALPARCLPTARRPARWRLRRARRRAGRAFPRAALVADRALPGRARRARAAVRELAARVHHERQRGRRGHPVRRPLRVPSARARARPEQARCRDVRRTPSRSAACPLHAAVHVGDSLDCDVAGAQAAGFRAVWLNRDGSAERDGDPARRRDRVARRARRDRR